VISVLLSSTNEREAQVLKMALKQNGIEVIFIDVNYQSYVKLLQYLPDLLIIEFPRICSEHLHFVSIVRRHKRTNKTPIIGYGSIGDAALKKGILGKGVAVFLDRPLKFTSIMGTIGSLLKRQNKSLEDARPPEKSVDTNEIAGQLLSADTLPIRKIEIMLEHVSKMMAFPFTVAQVIRIAEDSKSGAADLSRVITADPVISANLLKVSNTVFFAGANSRIASIKDAIVRIGFRETKNIVVSMAVMDLFDKKNKNIGFDRVDFWYHSLTTAIIGEHIAARIGGLTPEDAFLAGLLHDFGIVLLDEFFPGILRQALEVTTSNGSHFFDEVEEMIGIGYNDVVSSLFEEWKMPESLVQAVVGQNSFRRNYESGAGSPGDKLTVCVGLANVLAKTLAMGKACDLFVAPIDKGCFSAAKMPHGVGKNFLERIGGEVDLYRRFLKLDERDFLSTVQGVDNAEELRVGLINTTDEPFVPPAIYLSRQGMQVEVLTGEVDTDRCDGKFDLLVLWGNDSVTEETIRQYEQVVCFSRKEAVAGALPEFAPVLACVDAPDRLSIEADNISIIPREIDLRRLDRHIEELSPSPREDQTSPEPTQSTGSAGV